MKRRTLLLAALPLPAQAALNFPHDFGAHPATRIEWWYLTGLLGDRDGSPPRFGYQLTFFRVPGPAAAGHASALAARQLLLGHVALSDLVPGDNTLEFVTTHAPQSYPPVFSNIDLVLKTR